MLNACILWICSWGVGDESGTAGAEFILSVLLVSAVCWWSPILWLRPAGNLTTQPPGRKAGQTFLPANSTAARRHSSTQRGRDCYFFFPSENSSSRRTMWLATVERSSAKKETCPSRRHIFSYPIFLFFLEFKGISPWVSIKGQLRNYPILGLNCSFAFIFKTLHVYSYFSNPKSPFASLFLKLCTFTLIFRIQSHHLPLFS